MPDGSLKTQKATEPDWLDARIAKWLEAAAHCRRVAGPAYRARGVSRFSDLVGDNIRENGTAWGKP